MQTNAEGPAYTKGTSFRARAEAVQRQYRKEVLKEGYSRYGHCLDEKAAKAGANFVHPLSFEAASLRQRKGKGVAPRTFNNMLASQAMCFNLFAPLAADDQGREMAAQALSKFVPNIAKVSAITIEFTPGKELLGDQNGFGGVDCDVLVNFNAADGSEGFLTIETKFVEPEFSQCGFRSSKAKEDPCPKTTKVECDGANCRYSFKKQYLYWQRCREHDSLNWDKVLAGTCPFGGDLWQLWVNHTLVHALAAGRRSIFAVCAPMGNKELDAAGRVSLFSGYTSNPGTLAYLPLEELINELSRVAPRSPEWQKWAENLARRYVVP